MGLANIAHLCVKEMRSLLRDPVMMILIVYAFSLEIYSAAVAMPEALNKAPIAIIDEDRSPLSARIADAFYRPFFMPPQFINQTEMDARMDAGLDTFALNIPPGFQRDVLAGKQPAIQLNVDATRITQAFTGSGYVQAIVLGEVQGFTQRYRKVSEPPVDLALRARFNPELSNRWFASVIELISVITMLSIILTGAALIREREHGTIEHLLVMPVTVGEIMTSKVLSMGIVVFAATTFSLNVMIQQVLDVPLAGSLSLFMAGTALHLFATTSMGVLLATLARSMPQFGLLLMLVLLPLEMLSGGTTPRESMPEMVQFIMLAAPSTHFVSMAQAILFRGAGLENVWPQFLALAAIGSVLFALALARFRSTIGDF